MSTACLYTVVKNISGEERFFGFLPNHGRRLEADETMMVPGDLTTLMQRDPQRGERNFRAFEAALGSEIEIVRSPALFLQNLDSDDTVMFQVDGGGVEFNDPCYVD